ncbi:MAG: NUDIX hydrolase [Acidobacteriota bacterium]|nr:NUDIX hydrolase [Acidobacteriota bacterium]MDQ7087312.1 NUDIX hydrolase [Acidobacteriota bacterium]
MPDRAWTFLSRRLVTDEGIFRLYRDRFRLEGCEGERDFVVLDGPAWVNVIPLTADGEVVLIRQFRHGLRHSTVEIPGGLVDPGESPGQAALRELAEETGYRAEVVEPLGAVAPNPAIQSNLCHCFVARNVRKAGPARPDRWERIDVLRRPLEEIPGMIARGEIVHALVVAAFGLLSRFGSGR